MKYFKWRGIIWHEDDWYDLMWSNFSNRECYELEKERTPLTEEEWDRHVIRRERDPVDWDKFEREFEHELEIRERRDPTVIDETKIQTSFTLPTHCPRCGSNKLSRKKVDLFKCKKCKHKLKIATLDSYPNGVIEEKEVKWKVENNGC